MENGVRNIWVYDFEVYSKINWFCVTFENYEDDDDVSTIVNNRKELVKFYDSYKEDLFVSYNGRLYDTGIFKGILAGMNPGYLNDQMILEGKKPFQILGDARKTQLYDYDCIIKDKSLKVLEGFMGDDIRETQVDFNIDRQLTQEEVEQTLFYNRHDVKKLKKVLKEKWQDFQGHLDIIELYGLPMSNISKTKVQLAATVLNAVKQPTMDDEFDIRLPDTIRISEKYKFIPEWYMDPANWRYKEHLHSNDNQHNNQLCCTVAGIPHVFGWGGCHGADARQSIFEGIILHCDVSSMYPTTDIEYGLLSRKVSNPDDFRKMRDFRLELKAKKDSKNKALKPIINGVYGASKDKYGPMYDPLMGNLTCIFGQMFILDLVDKLEPYCRLLQTNTDGIFILCENEKMERKCVDIVNEVGRRTRMEYEIEKYTKLIQKDVNNYIAVTESGELECKGAMVKFNTPLDNDLPILNDAVRNFLAFGTLPENTINECDELLKFQKIIKLSSKYSDVWRGIPVYGKDSKGSKKVTDISGVQLKEKVHRIFASTRKEDGSIYKSKMEKGEKSYEKYANAPEHLFIDNSDLHGKPIPEYLDKQFYIEEAKKRIRMFLEKPEEKIDKTPEILFDCMNNSGNFYGFLEKCKSNGITGKTLEGYLVADCCSKYGKSGKLLEFRDWFEFLYGREKVNASTLNRKVQQEEIKEMIISHAKPSKTGKSYSELDFKSALLEIFDILEDRNIEPVKIMEMQVSKFGRPRFRDPDGKGNKWYVLNTRDAVGPTAILYNMTTGETVYRKIGKQVHMILPLQDGDVIDVKSTRTEHGMKIAGKDGDGVNITVQDPSKKYEVITGYEIIYRDYKKNRCFFGGCEDY